MAEWPNPLSVNLTVGIPSVFSHPDLSDNGAQVVIHIVQWDL